MPSFLRCSGAGLVLAIAASTALPAQSALVPAEPVPIWPNGAPNETVSLPSEADVSKPEDETVAGRPVVRLSNVTQPTLTWFPADAANNTGATVIVCPGGGYGIVAIDLEGIEICAWLNTIGVNGVLLKYRVPAREGRERHAAALEDAQRAVGLVRGQARELGIDPQRIGILGFSAGAHLAAALGANHDTRAYPAVDAADAVSCRPDFAVLLYPGGLINRGQPDVLRPEVQPVRDVTPPSFIAMTQDDHVRVENALVYYQALHRAGVMAELHVYPKGGHGYGLRDTGDLVSTWPDRVADWLQAGGWLRKDASS